MVSRTSLGSLRRSHMPSSNSTPMSQTLSLHSKPENHNSRAHRPRARELPKRSRYNEKLEHHDYKVAPVSNEDPAQPT